MLGIMQFALISCFLAFSAIVAVKKSLTPRKWRKPYSYFGNALQLLLWRQAHVKKAEKDKGFTGTWNRRAIREGFMRYWNDSG